jgi:hypothetical protein
MKMKNTLLAAFVFVAGVASAQVASTASAGASSEKTLFERITKIEKKNEWFNAYLNLHTGFNTRFNQNGTGGFDDASFSVSELRLEVTGKVTDWLSYRWRQRLNRGYDARMGDDNVPPATDVAGIGIQATKGLSFFAGRQCIAYGGFEFYANPIEIYKYSEIVDHMNIFMTGLSVTYDFTPTQQLSLQVLNSNGRPATEFYGKNIVASRLPLVYSIGWNASMCNDLWQTRWSFSAMNEVSDKYMYYVALGNQFNFSPKWNMYIDFMGSIENIDRKGMMTEILGSTDNHNVENAVYGAVVAKVNYRFLPKWNFFVKGMLDSAAMLESTDRYTKGNYRTTLGYLAGVEFYPMEDSNLHFFCTFVGQTNLFTEKAKAFGKSDYSTQRASLGLIYKLPMF